MSTRDDRLKKQKEKHEAPRFTPDDIVHAIEAVQRAGLTVYGVEIAPNGSIHIRTTSPFKHAAASKPETTVDEPDDVQPNKKRA